MGYKMKGPSLYKPKMADMDIQKNYDKKADDRPMSSPYQKASDEVDENQKTYEKMWKDSEPYKNLTKNGAPASAIAEAKNKWSGKTKD